MSRRLVVCCDGTWNSPDQPSGSDGAPTNVTKLALGVAGRDGEGTEQRVHYQKGVGTRRFERLRGGALGVGLSRNIKECYRFLVESYGPGDELYFFGFSRGAYTARSLAGLVRNSGILRPEHAARLDDAYGLYRKRSDEYHPTGTEAQIFRRMYAHEEEDLEIRFLGVWDTVGALGIPLRIPFLTRLWSFHDTKLSSRVRSACHALAIDERRGLFEPTLWQQQAHATGQTLAQVWFAGVHSDVGGGYRDSALSEIALLWMVERAREAGLAFRADQFTSAPGDVDQDARRLGRQVAPDALGAMHESRKGAYRLMPARPRSLAGVDGGSAASSAARRRREREDYDPPHLAEFLKGGGATTPVRDTP